ncbi:hypothetical protein BCR39DRAFT_314427 [Naematelia encephala]|uniref:Uncharacterized protein n=1 Tax=Naematelia encephala TaxID=71784 RepID=A0A1Y2AQK6_9TREE|nr:hypothetical protein BCR39DRAFT_314427 [Naematelia encephala]
MQEPQILKIQDTSKPNYGDALLHDVITHRYEMSHPDSPLDELLQDPVLTEDRSTTSTNQDNLPGPTNLQTLDVWGSEDVMPSETQVPQDSREMNQSETIHDFSVWQASNVQTAPQTGGPPQVSPIALVERELVDPSSHRTPLRPTLPCPPLQSAYTSVSRESLNSKRVADLEDVFDSTPAPKKRRKQHSEEADDEKEVIEVDPEKEQWRVGKTPGHQGSHIKSARKRSAEEDESLNQSINHNAERVLKRPFRPPKVVLAKAKPKLAPSSPDRGHHAFDSEGTGDKSTINNPSEKPFPVFRRQPLNRTSKLGKPFRSPAKTTDSSSPIKNTDAPNSSLLPTASDDGSTDLSLNSAAHLTKSAAPGITLSRSIYPCGQSQGHVNNATPRQQLTTLEARARKLRDALRSINDPEEDERLVSLTSQWRAAGREVVERLFALVPKPDTESTVIYKETIPSMTMFGDGVYSSPWKEIVFTPEQTECLRTAKRNAEGDPVDDDGELLLGDKSDSEEELRDELRKEVERGRNKDTGEYRSSLQQSGSWMDTSHEVMIQNNKITDCSLTPAEKSMNWDYGSMMLRFGVDPHLLGWNADEEDWDEVYDQV